MIGEFQIDGVFIPWLLLLAIAALAPTLLLRVILRRLHLYRWIWHAGLFDTALFVVMLWLLAFATAGSISHGHRFG